jgi:hypothetical protein
MIVMAAIHRAILAQQMSLGMVSIKIVMVLMEVVERMSLEVLPLSLEVLPLSQGVLPLSQETHQQNHQGKKFQISQGAHIYPDKKGLCLLFFLCSGYLVVVDSISLSR